MASPVTTTTLALTIILIFQLTFETTAARSLNDLKPTVEIKADMPPQSGSIPGIPGFMLPFPFPFPSQSSPPRSMPSSPGLPGFSFPFPLPSQSSPPGSNPGFPGFPQFRFPFPLPSQSSPPGLTPVFPGFPQFRFPFPLPSQSSPPGSIPSFPGFPGFPGFRFPPLPGLTPPQ